MRLPWVALVDNIKSSSTDIHLHFHLQRRNVSCPFCNSVTNKVHDYRHSIIKDAPIQGKFLFLHYKKRRYHCNNCGHHFNEPFSLLPKHCRITTRLSFLAIHLLKEVQNVSSVSRQLGISSSTVFRRMKDVSFPKPNHLPSVLSIDEFKGNAGSEKFQAILTDPAHHKVLDILPSRTQTEISSYLRSFSNRKQVKYFIMDMNKVYRDIGLTYFPNATIVIDKFHVVRYITWALENVRKRVQKDMHPSKRKFRLLYLYSSYWLGLIFSCPQLFLDAFAVLCKMFFEFCVFHSVHSLCTFVSYDLQICSIEIFVRKYLLH